MRAFLFAAAAVCVGLSGCGSDTSPKDVAVQIDPSIPKYHTPECETARRNAMKYDGMRAGDWVASAVMLPAFGTMPLAMATGKAYDGENEALHALEAACGHEALLSLAREQANNGDARSQAWMGQAYALGIGVKKDMSQAIHWYSLAAENGDMAAETNLGTYYAEGLGVPRDDVRAAGLWQQAANKGDPNAEESLAEAYAAGTGVKQNLKEAREYFYEAALAGLGHAQFALASMIEQGLGGAQSDVLAYEWYDVAARNRVAGAYEKRAAMAQKLSADALKDADDHVVACLEGRSSQCPASGPTSRTALPEQAHHAIATNTTLQ